MIIRPIGRIGRIGRMIFPTALTLVAHIAAAPTAHGHALAPSMLEIRELAGGRAEFMWKQAAAQPAGVVLRPAFPAGCNLRGAPERFREDMAVIERGQVDCGGTIVGRSIGIQAIEQSQTYVLLRLVLADGRSIRNILNAARPSIIVPEREGALSVAASYGRLGFDHILSGFDHLLFVLGLVLLVGGGSRLLGTVTAFTVGHSITLALAVLGFVNIPQQPIEAAIALSIFVLAVDLATPGKRSLLKRSPWLMAGVFGLLHGLGFAGALTEVGLPAGDIPLALFSFNAGIEAGQLAFVAAVLVVGAALRSLTVSWPVLLTRVPAYAIGSLAAFWFFQRVAAVIR